jgi:hypothetical protein
VSSRNGTDEQIQARVCVALRDLINRIGLGADPAVRPASITAYAGWETFTRTRRIEAAALHLGMASLDSTAALIGHDWQHTTDPDTARNGDSPDPDDLFGDRAPSARRPPAGPANPTCPATTANPTDHEPAEASASAHHPTPIRYPVRGRHLSGGPWPLPKPR